MRILMAASEAAGFARTGGLGDVMGSLPQELARLGHEVRVCLPWYSSISTSERNTRLIAEGLPIPMGDQTRPLTVGRVNRSRTRPEFYLLRNDELFDRDELYVDPDTSKDYADNHIRFGFFSRAVLELLRHLNWRPDVIHVHDWQAGLIPVYLRYRYSDDDVLGGTPTVLTIHNLGYQGVFDTKLFTDLDLPEELLYPMTGQLEFYEKLNFLKGAISTADKLTTVSPRYALEIQESEEYGFGLQGVLQQRADDLTGILNGVDYTIWSPSRDKEIPYRFHPANLSGKRMTKVELLNKAGLPHREKVPLIGMISRLAEQKGWDLIEEAAGSLLAMDLQMIVLGTGDAKYHELLQKLSVAYPDKLKVYLTFDNALAHNIEAGADVFLMPSRYEPCGLNQMYSLKYGTVPIVRRIGGLADTVVDHNATTGSGTGFVFEEYTARELIATVRRMLKVFSRRRHWTKLMRAGMRQDFSWARSAGEYARVYAEARSASGGQR